MKVFVTGSTGVVGRILVPRLVESGHAVVALVRNELKARQAEAMGAKAAIADPPDRRSLSDAVAQAGPEAIIHQLTALTGAGNFKKFDQEMALTNRFRTETTDILVEAARLAGTRRLIAQSLCGWAYAREGGPVKTEEDSLDPTPPASFSKTLAAIRHLERAVSAAGQVEGVALRYGFFYGPGTSIARDGTIVGLVRARKIPLVGDARGVWSFIHIRDAISATLAAMTTGAPGIYNVVDDDPAPVSAWLPALADAVGARRPRKLPCLAGTIRHRGRRCFHYDQEPRRVERQGQAPARLAADLHELAAWLRRRTRLSRIPRAEKAFEELQPQDRRPRGQEKEA